MPTPPRISYVVGRLDRAIAQEITALAAACGLSLPEFTALSLLRRTEGLSNAQLARRTFVRPQSMNQVVTGLEARGLIERSPDPGHARILRTALTAEGRRIVEVCERRVDRLEERMLEGIAAADRDALIAVLTHCEQSLGAGFPDAD